MDNNISNLSYTNKDFTSIFTEALDLVKKLSDKWDPSISNESDPGVVLLKVASLLTDKLNYNIDKNILETFPASVTQERNAWNLFEQLGYYMHWYVSGTTTVGIKWISPNTDGVEHTINLPRFTLVCDDSTSIFYTLTEPVSISTLNTNVISVPAIQGKPYTYSINGVSLITANNLDGTKLYFADTNVAENGIFITNDGFNNYDEWKKVDNLAVQDIGTRCYKFGVDIATNQCYIQFPDDLYDIIGDGIRLTYVISDGLDGNIKANTISKFYESSVDSTDGVTIDLSEDTILVTNSSSVINGDNVEDIDTAYRNYQKTIGVFKTLVSLSDYKNYLDASDIVSACVVSDRTTDVQTSYKVKHKTPEGYIVDNQHYENGELLPFDLKIVALKYQNTINSQQEFDVTFDYVDYSDTDRNGGTVLSTNVPHYINSYITDVKSIQHNIYGVDKEFTPAGQIPLPIPSYPALVRNKYAINVKIIPQYTLADIQINEVKNNIVKALYNNLNAKILNFGTEVTYDMVYNIIQNSDNRIKAIVLDDLLFDPFFEVFDSNRGKFVELPVAVPTIASKNVLVKSILNGNTPWRVTPSTKFGIFQDGHFFEDLYSGIRAYVQYTTDTNSTGKHTLGKNENIQIMQPNYQPTDEYSTGVRYEILLSHTIEADTNYTLQSGEYVFFYWQYNSNNEAPIYQFKAYGEGNVICPTFTLTTSTPTNIGQSIYGSGVDNSTDKIYSGIIGSSVSFVSGGQTYYFNKFINGEYNSVLGSLNKLQSGTRTITRKQVNHLHIDVNSKVKCYWITDFVVENEDDDTGEKELVYQLPTPKYGYLLKTNEYFIVATEDNSNLVIYGAGTLITVDGLSTFGITVPYIDATNVLNNGTSSVVRWYTLSNGVTIDAVEMSIVNLGEGTTLVVSNQSATQPIVLNNEHYATYKIVVNDNGLAIDSGYSAIFSDANSTIQYGDTYLQNGTYYLTTSLGLSMSPDNPMVLTNYSGTDETMTVTLAVGLFTEGEEEPDEVIDVDSSSLVPVYILPSHDVDVVSGVWTIYNNNALNVSDYVSIYAYSYASSLSSNISAYNTGDITISTETTATITEIELPAGTYLVPVINPNKNITMSINNTTGELSYPVYDIYGNSITDKGYGIWYMILKFESILTNLEFTFTGGDSNHYIYVLPATKIENTDLVEILNSNGYINSQNQIVAGLLAASDFAWDYEIPMSELIENPLTPTALHNKSHIMHNCTIDMLDIENSSIEILNR